MNPAGTLGGVVDASRPVLGVSGGEVDDGERDGPLHGEPEPVPHAEPHLVLLEEHPAPVDGQRRVLADDGTHTA